MPDRAPRDRRRLTEAARLLFPAAEVARPGFWAGLDLPRLRQAFRREVRRWHPDAPWPSPPWPAAARRARFQAVKEAYDLLREHLREAPSLFGPRVTAVAGAKGGVGASLIAANLGVLLARAGRRVILVDLDPAGPTLSLYLRTPLRRSSPPEVCPSLEESPFGPALLAGWGWPPGGEGDLRPQKLLAELQALEADEVLCDLGTAPDDPALDLFLSARRQVLVTTCEPAAYVRAYAFLKRLRQRLSMSPRLTAASAANTDFVPLVLFNQVTPGDRLQEMSRRLKEVATRCLGLTLTVLSLPFRKEIAQSARELVPAAVRETDWARGPWAPLSRLFLS